MTSVWDRCAGSRRAFARATGRRFREYRYLIWNGPPSPLRERYALESVSRWMSRQWPRRAACWSDATTSRPSGGRPTIGPHPSPGDGPAGRLLTIEWSGATHSCARWSAGSSPRCSGWDAARGRVGVEGWSRRTPAFDGALAPGRDSGGVSLGRPPGKGTKDEDDHEDLHAREAEIERQWFVVDADGETLGRLASRIARVLEGKHKPTYAPHIDCGDHVIVLNAAKIDGPRRQAERRRSTRATAATRGVRGRRRSATCSRGGRRRSFAAPSRGCCRATSWASSSCAS